MMHMSRVRYQISPLSDCLTYQYLGNETDTSEQWHASAERCSMVDWQYQKHKRLTEWVVIHTGLAIHVPQKNNSQFIGCNKRRKQGTITILGTLELNS